MFGHTILCVCLMFNQQFEITKETIKQLIKWNTQPHRNNCDGSVIG